MNSTQLAEKLARKTSQRIDEGLWRNHGFMSSATVPEFEKQILESLPLVELLECVGASVELSHRCSMVQHGVAESIELIGLNNALQEQINILNAKLGGDVE